MKDIVALEKNNKLFLSPVGCYGILRRKTERNIIINSELEKYLEKGSSKMTLEEIEKKSKVQKRSEFFSQKNYSELNIFNFVTTES